MSIKSIFTAALSFLYVGLSAQSNNITLFEDCNYSGKSQYLQAGSYRTYQLNIGNDMLSSIQIPNGMKVTIYQDDNYKGKSKTYFANTTCLDNEWNDQASSIVVEDDNYNNNGYGQNNYIVFYNDCNNKGYSRTLKPGTYSGNELGQLKYNISSFAIFGNLKVRVYLNNESASGYSSTFDASQTCLSDSYNDKIGSLVIEYNSGGNNNYPGNNNPGNNNNNYPGNGYGKSSYATIYANCNYKGNSLRLEPGTYSGDKLGLLKYNISSIEIPSDLTAKVYTNSEYMSGTNYTITQNTSCLATNMNNKIGSLVIERKYGNGNNNNYPGNNNNYPGNGNNNNFQKVILYTDGNYKGQSASLLPGTYYTMAEAGFTDKALSSLSVPAGFRVVIYDGKNFSGKSYTITSTLSSLGSKWNDKASSIAVYRDK